MIPIEKVRNNLKQSEEWGLTFKTEIKKIMEEITIKNQEIGKLGRANLDLQEKIEKTKSEAKGQAELKMKIGYKIDKLTIKFEELEGRYSLYQGICTKKEDWQNELKNKAILLELDIEKERHSLI
jgi:hypothetical protein